MRKRFLLIGYNYAPEPTGIGKYSGEMVDWLADNGCDCTVITTYPYYPYWSVQEPYRKKRFWFHTERYVKDSGAKITVIRCPIYVPKTPSGLKRIILDFTFLISSFLPMVAQLFKKKYDVAMAVAPSFLVGILAALYRLFRKTNFVYHIQDMQIEAAEDLGMIKSKRLISVLFAIEKWILKKADTVSSISDGMMERIEKKAKKPIYFLPNWTNVSAFHPLKDRGSIKEAFGFEASDKIALYSGGIGQKQGLEAIVDAAEHFKKQSDVKFVICGSGPYKKNLEEMVKASELNNVVFFPLQPIEKFNSFLNLADVHLVIQKADASDLMLPSKLTTILSVGGLALITANSGSGLYKLVEKYEVGKVVHAENLEALIQGLEESFIDSDSNEKIRNLGRKYAEDFLNIDAIMGRFLSDCF